CSSRPPTSTGEATWKTKSSPRRPKRPSCWRSRSHASAPHRPLVGLQGRMRVGVPHVPPLLLGLRPREHDPVLVALTDLANLDGPRRELGVVVLEREPQLASAVVIPRAEDRVELVLVGVEADPDAALETLGLAVQLEGAFLDAVLLLRLADDVVGEGVL